MPVRRKLLSVQDAAEILNVGVPRAYALVRQGGLPVVRIGRQIRIDPNQLEAFIAAGGKPIRATGGEDLADAADQLF